MAKEKTATLKINALDKTARVFSKVERRLSKLGRKTKSIGKNLSVALTAPLAGIGIAAGVMGADFESAMNNVNSLLSLPQAEFQKLREETRALGVEMGVDLPTAANALYQAISAGVPKENAIDFLRVASQAAIAGVAQVDESVTLLTKTMDAYGSKSVDVRTLSDQLFATVKGGVTNFSELAGALPNVAGLAANLNVESSELLGVLARTTKVSESTSGAVTRIASAMGALIKPSADMASLLKKANIQNVALEIKSNGLTKTLLKLREAAKGNETVLAKAFGRKEAILLLQDLASNSEKWREQIDAVTNSGGEMEKAFAINDRGMTRSMERIKAAFQGVADAVAIQLSPYVEKFSALMTRMSTVISEADPKIIKIALVIAGIAAAIGPVLVVTGLLINSLAAVAGFFTAGGLVAAVGVITGIVIITGAAKAVMDSYDGSIKTTSGSLTGLGDIAAQVFQFLSNTVDLVSIAIQALGVGVLKLVEFFARAMQVASAFPRLWQLVTSNLQQTAEKKFNATLKTLESFANKLLNLVSDTAEKVINGILKTASTGFEKLINGLSAIPGAGKLLGIDKPIKLSYEVTAPRSQINIPEISSGTTTHLADEGGAEAYWRSFADGVGSDAESLGMRVGEAWNRGASDSIIKGWESVRAQTGTALEEIKTNGTAAAEALKRALEKAAAAGANGGGGGAAGAIRRAADEMQGLQSAADEALSAMGQKTDAVFNGLGNAIDNFVETGKFSFEDFASSVIKDLIKMELRAQASQLFRSVIGGLIGGYGSTSSTTTLSSYSGGGYTGNGARSGGVDGKGGFPAILHPNETITDHTRGQQTGGNVTISQTIQVTETVPAAMAQQLAERAKASTLAALQQIKQRGGKRAAAY